MFTERDVRDRFFACDNDLDIPTLLSEQQATILPRPFHVWNAPKAGEINGGTIAFYTWDTRFSIVKTHPEKVINTNCAVLIEPNFTIYDTTPFPEALAAIYAKRKFARLCQEFGIRIVVDLFVAPRYAELNLVGVPKKWTAYATRGTSRRLEELPQEFALACEHAETDKILFVVYGGGEQVRAWCRQTPQAIHVPEVVTRLRQRQVERAYLGADGKEETFIGWEEQEA